MRWTERAVYTKFNTATNRQRCLKGWMALDQKWGQSQTPDC